MLKQIHLIVNDDELNTICTALDCVQYWHNECIKEGFSIDAHREMIKKERELFKIIQEGKKDE